MESLWQYIQSLSLSDRNKKWLAEKLVEDTKADDTEYISKEEMIERSQIMSRRQIES